jgi:hypothetical protein
MNLSRKIEKTNVLRVSAEAKMKRLDAGCVGARSVMQ